MKKMIYYIYSVETDLPVCIAETAQSAADFIGCCIRELFYMLNTGNELHGYKVLSFSLAELELA